MKRLTITCMVLLCPEYMHGVWFCPLTDSVTVKNKHRPYKTNNCTWSMLFYFSLSYFQNKPPAIQGFSICLFFFYIYKHVFCTKFLLKAQHNLVCRHEALVDFFFLKSRCINTQQTLRCETKHWRMCISEKTSTHYTVHLRLCTSFSSLPALYQHRQCTCYISFYLMNILLGTKKCELLHAKVFRHKV